MKNELEQLLLRCANELSRLTKRLKDNEIDLATWRREFIRILTSYFGLVVHGAEARSIISALVSEQAAYLDGFAQDYLTNGWQESFVDRARMYADALREPYWIDVTECLHLPIHPNSPLLDCGSFCKCYLTIRWLDRENCSADIYWHTTTVEHSPDCARLELEWNPLRVRNGVVENG